MPPTTKFSRGDIVLVPFQFSDRPVFKLRPTIVVSADTYHAGRRDVIIAAVTSRIREPLLTGDQLIGGWKQSGLPKPSVATAILRTVKDSMISRRIGALTKKDLSSVDRSLVASLGLTASQR